MRNSIAQLHIYRIDYFDNVLTRHYCEGKSIFIYIYIYKYKYIFIIYRD